MQIKEVSQKTGLTIKTIRFYEERGLIHPKQERRNGRTYRDYQAADVAQLEMVAVLRKCLFSLDQIQTMQEHPELTPDIFTEYRDSLLSQRDLLERLAEKAETVDPDTLTDPETLARRLTTTARPLPLPTLDIEPNFGRFDPETPEERQAAYLKWQKRYRHRYARWLIPLGAAVLALLLVTGVYAAHIAGTSRDLALGLGEQLAGDLPGSADVLRMRCRKYADRADSLAFGVYTGDGDALYTETSDPLAFQLEQLTQRQTETQSIHSGIFRQEIQLYLPLAHLDQTYYLAVYLRQSPFLTAAGRLVPLYLVVLLAALAALAIRSTKGYGFRVVFLRNYGLRGTWNDALLSIDEENGNATMLTHQYTGMGNLVNMDYKKKD